MKEVVFIDAHYRGVDGDSFYRRIGGEEIGDRDAVGNYFVGIVKEGVTNGGIKIGDVVVILSKEELEQVKKFG